LALSVPLSRFTSRVGGGSAFFVRWQIIMEYSDPQLISNVRKFKRKTTLWGLPYAMLSMWILVTFWNAIVPPQPFSFSVGVKFFLIFILGGTVLLLPFFWMSHNLRKRYGLICPVCGRRLSIKRENRVTCTLCNPRRPNAT
jgi:hypothetical protein